MDNRAKENVLIEVDVVRVNEKQRLREEVDEKEWFLRKETFLDSEQIVCWLYFVAVQLLKLDDVISLLDHLNRL